MTNHQTIKQMNNKHILLEKYIKVSIRKALKEQEELQKQAEKLAKSINF